MEKKNFAPILLFVFTIASCALHTPPPDNPDNICSVFREKTKWYSMAKRAEKRWGVPIYVMMAIMHKESHFQANAKPPRKRCLFFFPGPRLSSAYGYAQALSTTWDRYILATANWGADRNNFEDSIDFIGWYCHLSYKKCSIQKFDAYNLYMAYHEGHGGFRRKTFKNNPVMNRRAKSVEFRAAIYNRQLARCEKSLPVGGGCFLFPFF